MSTKQLVKAAAEAIKKQQWDDAIEGAKNIIDKDNKSYQGHILLAFALDKKGRLEEAENTYLAATRLKPEEKEAWQGLVKLYPNLDTTNKFKQHQHAVLKLAEIFRDANDLQKCYETVDSFITYARTKAEPYQYVDALDLILPESPIYEAIEGRFGHVWRTYETQAQLVEQNEKKRINTLIGERRTRIGARINEVTLEVKREVYRQSRLSYTYAQLINWTNDDEVRRMYEEKLMQYGHDRLMAWPPGEEKERELANVLKLANDMVIIKHPYKLAWDIAINWQDHKEIKEWDVTVLRQYCTFFPDSDLNRVVMGFLTSSVSPFPQEKQEQTTTDDAAAKSEGSTEESEDDEDGGAATIYAPITEEDRLLMMTEGISGAESLLAFRLMGEYYQHLEEWESNVELMRKALTFLKEERAKTGLDFRFTEDAFSLYLGTALVFYQTPRNHQEAKVLFDAVLAHDPTSTPAMIGVGLIYEEEEEYDEAIDFLERALKRDPDNIRVRTEAAWVKALKRDFDMARAELDACIPILSKKGQSKEILSQTQYRLGYCIWNIDTSKAARKDRSGAYAMFLESLKNNLNYAPAYTILGIYYADYAKDKKRARRCFQKAVELSPSEVESAERLARSFADDGDWDRVELVAQRVVDSGKVKPPPGSKRKGISWPFAALGVAELNKQEFHKAIVSFQSALRISPNDYHSWVGLGEAYHSSGRYIAATKAILNAQKLEESCEANLTDETWFTKFILADIKRELGDFDESIELYQHVMQERPDEEGVATALMQTLVDNAFDSLNKGFFGKAAGLAAEALTFATKAPDAIKDTFNYWKAIGDACSLFSTIQGRISEFPAGIVRSLLGTDDDLPAYQILKDIDNVGTGIVSTDGIFPKDETVGVDLTKALQATILAHKRSIHIASSDVHAQSVAYYNLGWAEYRAHACLPPDMRKNSHKKPTNYIKAAMACFKRAIELEAGNSEFWNALGVVTSEVNPAVAQHAFCRSLFLNERGAHVWANLATLALAQGDLGLANEAFTRSQSTDPDYSLAWLGQGVVALLTGNEKDARGLFTHAMEISGDSCRIISQRYAVSMFDYILSCSSSESLPITTLIQPIFALSQLQSLHSSSASSSSSTDLAYTHLLALFLERTGELSRAISILDSLSTTLEQEYETTESPLALKHFAIVKSDLARCQLSAHLFSEAIDSADLALQLSSDDSADELTAEEGRKLRLSAHVTLGLAKYYSHDIPAAVAAFDQALSESDTNPDVVCLLAQIRWATGSEESRERGRDLLFSVIADTAEKDQQQHVQSVLLLGVIALLDNDAESMDAVVSELQTLRSFVDEDFISPEQQAQLGEVLRAILTASGEGQAQPMVDVMLHPFLPHGWARVAQLALASSCTLNEQEEEGQQGISECEAASEMALRVARKGVPPRGNLTPEDLARAYAGTGRPADAQVGVVVAPWERSGWESLGHVVTVAVVKH
ncbi:hypothetical protein QBC45DRAFT_411063 [Copromyces sp. CBS 386.78]|nr:hypothetical protein QBC45DRAFT_411063 [Copromyces sp. CBS 386.78]